MTEFVTLRTFPSRLHAEFAQAILAEAGIRSMVSADDSGGAYAGLSFSAAGVRLLVRPDDQADAEAALSSGGEGDEE